MQCMHDVGLSREQLESDYGRRCVRSSRFIFLETLTPSLVIFFYGGLSCPRLPTVTSNIRDLLPKPVG
jgi:hypothetical protein